MKPVLQTLICSTRPGRAGPAVARWFHQAASDIGSFETELVDLDEFKLPVFDEPEHPRLRKYHHEHTRRWSASVGRADAFVFVLPEYNYSPPPSLLNAMDYLVAEWSYKPVAFVSYGGVGGGLRAMQAARLMTANFRMVPIQEAVPVFNFREQIGADGVFTPSEPQRKAVGPLVAELHKLVGALKPLYAPPSA
ncbi:NADPH-dependent FMN reductase [Ramlibacter rhizophilus]|uniref:NADPH-dependent oxidoreductase n=1 Tax=Ramlibacter rhizophilus TaxID=1781167 RepID=A0A4Z0BS18_9BURK|nr:NAD(P)H-dependent oxidoreductase [Ramlibacter rhizophilus]TFZ01254.1 NADPH-dependent oxidoreductase [Ramlibacter rhizophilus]